ncbi:hypothetical protein Scep_021940 [Stephania cephalantha]|uniref:Uncharacterized protein n=1 Tax=Stephania cephalantha TaxID=152367 RepID=A0AAP0F4E0_9MAGN
MWDPLVGIRMSEFRVENRAALARLEAADGGSRRREGVNGQASSRGGESAALSAAPGAAASQGGDRRAGEVADEWRGCSARWSVLVARRRSSPMAASGKATPVARAVAGELRRSMLTDADGEAAAVAQQRRRQRRRGGALPDRLIPDEAQQQWTRRRDFDEARRRDGLLAKETRGVGHETLDAIVGCWVRISRHDRDVLRMICDFSSSYLDAVDISQLSVRWGHLSGSVDIS